MEKPSMGHDSILFFYAMNLCNSGLFFKFHLRIELGNKSNNKEQDIIYLQYNISLT